MKRSGFYFLSLLFLVACSSKKPPGKPLFAALKSDRTGLHFTNKLKYSPQFNLFKYMYFYNGSGVGTGDFNNDGKLDLFFGSNQGQNRLFLNKGDLSFIDVTDKAAIPDDGGWTTGISVVDINNDGLLDIYVCRVGQYETLHSRNQFLINQGLNKDGVPQFVDKAKELGLDFSGFSTQAAFFDYDNDGDLDMFLLNHSVHQNNNFRPRAYFEGTFDSLSGDRIFRNEAQAAFRLPQRGGARAQTLALQRPGLDSGVVDKSAAKRSAVTSPLGEAEGGLSFTDVTRLTGIHSTAISYGLGVAVADINLDGYPDLYIGNDFHENDYLYINQKNGTFKEESANCLMHTSQYSMGVDVADVNNDAQPEIISMDMLPSDPYILKRSLGEDTYDLFYDKIGMGYFYQYTRNNLQYNRGIASNGSRKGEALFSEVGLYSGIAATDWSWAPLWMDFDNDGWKDLFISNGIPKRMNDIDYVNFVTNSDVQQKISTDDFKGKDLSLISKFPEIKLPNKFYRNSGNLLFEDEAEAIDGNDPTFSNGAVYADFDNDGDLDIVVNNIDEPVLLYENKTENNAASVQVTLNGPAQNRNAVGTKLVAYVGSETRTYENIPVKGFLSSMDVPVHIGLKGVKMDSLLVVWPDRTYERLSVSGTEKQKTIAYRQGLPFFDFSRLHRPAAALAVEDITVQTGLAYQHQENRFVEFDREPLIPHAVSTEGPCTAVADVNGDGLDDVFIGGARNQQAVVFLQQSGGRFAPTAQPALAADSSDEDTDACWADVNKDGYPDLIVGSGGNEFYGPDAHNTPRVYLNNGRGELTRLPNPFGEVFLTASCVVANDINGDGYTDLFIGGRAVPWAYGELPQSYLFLNNKNGTFSDVTERYAKDLKQAGFMTRALWFDLNKDGRQDLLLSLEWGGLVAYLNRGNGFEKRELTDKKGWWNFLLPADVDGDGDVDLLAGNLGLNSRLKASPEKPVRLYYNDFDGNGKKEQVLTYYVGGKEVPFASKAELEKQMPVLKKKFLYAEDLAKASLGEIFGEDKLEKASLFTADYFANAVLINKGNLNFETKALPWQAQLSPFKDAVLLNTNSRNPDIFLAGNFYENNVEMGRYDADYGTLLRNNDGGNFAPAPLDGFPLKGQVRRIQSLKINGQTAYLLARNNDPALMIKFTQPAALASQKTTPHSNPTRPRP